MLVSREVGLEKCIGLFSAIELIWERREKIDLHADFEKAMDGLIWSWYECPGGPVLQ